MILGHADHIGQEVGALPAPVRRALEFIRSKNWNDLADGTYEIDGARFYVTAQRYETKERSLCRAETHASYVDVQYLLAGKECVGYCPYSPAIEVEEDCLAQRDARFYRDLPDEATFVLTPGAYAVFFPNDVHRPCGAADKPCSVRKLVVKIHVELFGMSR